MATKKINNFEENGIEITEVKFFEFKKKGSNLKGFATITLNNVFVITGIKLMTGGKGDFIAMPSTLGSDDEYHDVCFPLSKEARAEIYEAVKEAAEN